MFKELDGVVEHDQWTVQIRAIGTEKIRKPGVSLPPPPTIQVFQLLRSTSLSLPPTLPPLCVALDPSPVRAGGLE